MKKRATSCVEGVALFVIYYEVIRNILQRPRLQYPSTVSMPETVVVAVTHKGVPSTLSMA